MHRSTTEQEHLMRAYNACCTLTPWPHSCMRARPPTLSPIAAITAPLPEPFMQRCQQAHKLEVQKHMQVCTCLKQLSLHKPAGCVSSAFRQQSSIEYEHGFNCTKSTDPPIGELPGSYLLRSYDYLTASDSMSSNKRAFSWSFCDS